MRDGATVDTVMRLHLTGGEVRPARATKSAQAMAENRWRGVCWWLGGSDRFDGSDRSVGGKWGALSL